jgi:aspartyl-tRNA(Asn)/glutamyl-tRNA(Gln) amidotransferase subunit A
MELHEKPLHELTRLLEKGEVSSRDITENYLKRIEKFDGELGSYLTVAAENALAEAARADDRMANKKRLSVLDGIPIAIKDIFITEGIETTCASKILKGYVPPYDGTHSSKLKEAGAVMLGKLNMDEFAMGSSNEFSGYKVTRNPWNKDCAPGGSSGGSAAAVAAGLCAGSLGTDTGGSIRQPAAMCGLVGLKPTYGRVSRYGMISFASSLDQAGPMAWEVTDCAYLLKVMAGHDPKDSTSLDVPVPDYAKALKEDVKGMRIGIPKEYSAESVDSEVEQAIKQAATKFVELGAKLKEVSLPHTDYAVPTYYIIAPAEASSNLARYDGIRYGHRTKKSGQLDDLYEFSRTEGFGPEVILRIVIGTYVLSTGYYDAYYLKAQKVRTLIKNDFLKIFDECDVILSPTTPTPAFKLGEKADDPVKMYLSDIFTIPASLAGLPGLSMPCGFSSDGLPIGLQLIGKPLDEETLLKTAYTYEQATDWHTRRPQL